MREEGEGDVTVLRVPAPHVVLVEPAFLFGCLEGLLDRPPHPGDPHHGAEAHRCRCEGDQALFLSAQIRDDGRFQYST